MYKDIEKLKFHIFTDSLDDWTKTEEEAMLLIEDLKSQGYENFRVYTCEWNEEEGIYNDIDCILSIGNFPQ
jgi:hypothetical protein